MGSAFIANATTMLEDVLSADGTPDTRTALYCLLGMGPLVHEGSWTEDGMGEAATMPPEFYKDIRTSIGLSSWEYGRL